MQFSGFPIVIRTVQRVANHAEIVKGLEQKSKILFLKAPVIRIILFPDFFYSFFIFFVACSLSVMVARNKVDMLDTRNIHSLRDFFNKRDNRGNLALLFSLILRVPKIAGDKQFIGGKVQPLKIENQLLSHFP